MTPSQSAQNSQQSQTAGQIVVQNRISTTVVLRSLSILLGIFFIFIGALKLTPHISRELHKDLVSAISSLVDIFGFWLCCASMHVVWLCFFVTLRFWHVFFFGLIVAIFPSYVCGFWSTTTLSWLCVNEHNSEALGITFFFGRWDR